MYARILICKNRAINTKNHSHFNFVSPLFSFVSSFFLHRKFFSREKARGLDSIMFSTRGRSKSAKDARSTVNNRQTIVWIFANLCFLILAWLLPATAVAQQPDSTASAPKKELLDDAQWQRIDQSVERSLTWLSKQQRPDGSFPTDPGGQPAVTALWLQFPNSE